MGLRRGDRVDITVDPDKQDTGEVREVLGTGVFVHIDGEQDDIEVMFDRDELSKKD